MPLNDDTKAHVIRLLVFYLSENIKQGDQERILNTIAAEAGVTRNDVWDVYTEMLQAAFNG